MFRFSHLYILASEHNRIASQLKIKLENEMFFQSLSLREQDECIYQETRRIVIAEVSWIIILINNQIDIFLQFQNIVYQEYLPLVVGPKMMENYRLDIRDRLTKYNPNTDPRVSNEFSTVDKISHKFSFLICLKGCLSFWSFPSSARV